MHYTESQVQMCMQTHIVFDCTNRSNSVHYEIKQMHLKMELNYKKKFHLHKKNTLAWDIVHNENELKL